MSTDYYELLELSRSAALDDIRVAIRQQRRLWVRRQSSPDPARRTEAEQRIRDLDQAEKTLLDRTSRAAYDRTLGGSAPAGPQQPEARSPDPADDGRERHSKREWLDRARSYVAQGNAAAATRAARSARDLDRSDPEAWYFLGLASTLDRRLDDAEQELAEALRLRPDDVDTRVRLGAVYLDLRKWRPAIAEFERVLVARPGDPAARAGLGEAYVHTDRVDDGVAMLRTVVAENSDDLDTKRALAIALYEQAIGGLAEVPEGRVALSARQVSLLRKNLNGLNALQLSDPQIDALTAELQGALDDACKRVKIRSLNLRYYLAGIGAGILMAAFAPSEFFQVVAAAVIVATVLIYVRRHRPPAWRVRRRDYGRRITKRGI